jgi:YegS/Rv2252/BmrU family lipid kinase
MPTTRCHIVFNGNAGTAHALGLTTEILRSKMEEHGIDAEIDDNSDHPLDERVKAAIASDAPVIVAAGGDGTITALANAIVETDKVLAVLPLGTVNALAKDLTIPLDLDAAIDVLAAGTEQRIDVGEVAGRVFLHKVVIGFIPALAAGREHIRGREQIMAKLGFLRYFFRRLARAKRFAVAITPADGVTRTERVQALAVASNAYDEGFGQFFHRHRLDRGELTLYVLKHFTFGDFVRLTSGMLMGRWRDDAALTIESIQGVTINSKKNAVKVMFDGEVETMPMPLTFRIRPKALRIIAPEAMENTPEETITDVAQEVG